nr:hypothetical protein [Tanacetum cinerariifolium]
MFNRLQVIVIQLQFMDVKIEQHDLNQKFLTNLAPEWLMHTIVWRNRSDLDTMSLDDLYNHIKVYESEVQKKSELNSQTMAFISSAKHSSGNKDGNTTCVPTASTIVPTASASIATISQDTACAYIASQASEFALMANTNAKSKVFDNSLCSKDSQVESRLVEYKEREVKYCEKIRTLKQEKEGVDGKKDLDNLIESQRADKNKEGLGYSVVPLPPAQIYSSHKKDLSGTGLLEFADDTVTDYSRPSPTIESTSGYDQNINPFVSETVVSPMTPKPFIKFVKPKDSQSKSQNMQNHLTNVRNKMHKAFPLSGIEFPLAEEVPTASEEGCHCQKKREATAKKIALLSKSRRNYTTSGETGKKSGRTVTLTAEDMQKKKNDVKARTTLLLSLPDEHQLRF